MHADTQQIQKPVPKSRDESLSTEKNAIPVVPPSPASGKLTSMQSAMRQKLISARFRHLNETLYTKPSTAAQQLFDENPEMFGDYHAGFRQQVSVWPENPIDKFIAEIRSRGRIRQPKKEDKGTKRHWKAISEGKIEEALPRTHGTAIIADLGCGDARLAQTLKDSGDMTQLNLRLHSFDLHSQSPLVTKADISNVPLEDGSVDIAIFCLALMGTNWISFIEEAYRILHWKGELWVAEIKSRFGRVGKSKGKVVEHSVGSKRKREALKALKEAKKRSEDDRDEQDVLQTEVDGVPTNTEETDVSAFVDVLKRRGFVLKSANGVDLRNKMFVKMEFVKALTPTKGKGVADETKPGMKKAKTKFIPELEDEVLTEDEAGTLKPCLYKIR
jgi:ribosomal RNA-processing protein 8